MSEFCNRSSDECQVFFFFRTTDIFRATNEPLKSTLLLTELDLFLLFLFLAVMELVAYYLSKVVPSLDYCLCFDLKSSLIKPPSTLQTFFTFTLLSDSYALLQTPTVLRIPSSSGGQRSFSDQTRASWNQIAESVPHAASDSSVNIFFKNRSLF